MSDTPKKKALKLTSFFLLLLAIASFTWSIVSIGRGVWQLSRSKVKTVKNNPNIPNFASVPNVTPGVFNYGGSTAWASLRLAVDSVIQSERPEMQLRYVQPQNEPPGSSPGIEMLLDGKLAFVQSSRALSLRERQLAQQRGLKLQQVPVAIDSIAVAVNPQLDISSLTLTQLQGIYTGEISNWQELGGADLPIKAYSRPLSTGGIVNFFSSTILGDRSFGSNVEFVSTTTQALRKLANNPGSIYYGSAPAIVPQCSIKPLSIADNQEAIAPYRKPKVPASECPQKRNQLNFEDLRNARYPLTYYLYVVFLENEASSQVGRAYANFLLTPQGQKLIAKTGLVPLD